MRVAIVPSTVGFHWEEVYDAYKQFKNAGWGIEFYTVDAKHAVADPKSLERRPILSFLGIGLRKSYSPDTVLGKEISYMSRYETQDVAMLNVDAVDVIFIPGGHGSLFDVNINSTLHQKLLEAYHKGKILSGVCHGTSTFAFVYDNGKCIVKGRRVIGFPKFLDKLLLRFGGIYKDYLPLPFFTDEKLKSVNAKISKWNTFLSIINPFYKVKDLPFITGVGPKSARGVARRVIKKLKKKAEEPIIQGQPAFA